MYPNKEHISKGKLYSLLSRFSLWACFRFTNQSCIERRHTAKACARLLKFPFTIISLRLYIGKLAKNGLFANKLLHKTYNGLFNFLQKIASSFLCIEVPHFIERLPAFISRDAATGKLKLLFSHFQHFSLSSAAQYPEERCSHRIGMLKIETSFIKENILRSTHTPLKP